jgi:Zn-dependent protease
METIFLIAILIMSVIIHEISHGYVAYILGDSTAKLAGRLTLNPVSHIDPLGSIPYNLKNQRWGTALVGAAGALSNLLIALVFGAVIRFSSTLGVSEPFIEISMMIVLINILLAVFNLLPVPPLDGSKVLFSVIPYRFHYIQEFLERNWLFLIFFVILFAGQLITPIINILFTAITGVHLGFLI